MKSCVWVIIFIFNICFPSNSKAESEKFIFSSVFFKDSTNSYKPAQLLTSSADSVFAYKLLPSTIASAGSTYWLKINYENASEETFVLVLSIIFSQIEYYQIDKNGELQLYENGYSKPYYNRTLKYNAPAYYLPPTNGNEIVLIKLQTNINSKFDFKILNNNDFYNISVDQFLYYGFFFGVLAVAILYCFVLFWGLRDFVYLYYALYVFSFLIFALVDWGVFNKFVSSNIDISYDLFAVPYAFMTIFLLLYSQYFLKLKQEHSKLNKLVYVLILIKIGTYPITKITHSNLFYNDLVDIFLISIALTIGYYSLKHGFNSAKFYIVGIGLILIYLILSYLKNMNYIDFGSNSLYFSVYNFGLAEVFVFSISLADRYKTLNNEYKLKTKNVLQYKDQLIEQLNINEQHKDVINNKLEIMVLERTSQLDEANRLLAIQTEEIKKLNTVLEADNVKLINNVARISKERFDLKLISIEEFKEIYPDDDACYRFIEDLKWKNNYSCLKCAYAHHSSDKYSRKCSKCGYVESVLVNTIFSRIKFPLHKAFYIIYMLQSGNAPSQERLSELLELRRATISLFVRKVKSILIEKKLTIKTREGWTNFILLKDN